MGRMMKRILIEIFMLIFVSVVQCYTWLTLPLYYFIQKPWIRREANNRPRMEIYKNTELKENCVIPTGNTDSPIYRRIDNGDYSYPIFNYDTITDMFENIQLIHSPDRRCLGFRQVLSEEVSLDDQGKVRRIDGRPLRKYRLSEYKWLTYSQVNTITKNLAQGFMANNINKYDKVMIISETRIEWMLTFQALLKTGSIISTVFSNLGIDGIAHGIDEVEAKTVITSIECFEILKLALKKLKNNSVKQIIYIDGIKKPEINEIDTDKIKIQSLSSIEELGKEINKSGDKIKPYHKASQDDVTVIMYTSGTSGTPKAATLTQRQFVSSVKAIYVLVRHIIDENYKTIYMSYLPMAHVMELTLEIFFCIGGVRLGYASPFTLTDSAPGLCEGQIPDIKLLKPNVMTTVPLVLDRIIKEINEKLQARTPVSLPVFKFLIDYKSYWVKHGYQCNIVTKLLCEKVRSQLGGNLKYMICGGAPLSPNTQATIKSALNCHLIQGYGATETCGASICMDFDCLDYGSVGAPLGQVYFKLRDWPEGGYSVNDKPNPRGEIMLGGDIIALNYYNKQEQTKQAFYTDENGIRWFLTGDIGEIFPNYTLRIIDRCKDLIKLQNGEYISLGKVEAALKGCQFVDNICVYGGTFSCDIVALISPNRKALEQLLKKIDKSHMIIVKEICDDPEVELEIYNEIVNTAKHVGLGKKEIPRRIKLVPEEWTPDNGLLTAAMKLKRRVVESKYKQELYDLYNFNVISTRGCDQNNNINNTDANYMAKST